MPTPGGTIAPLATAPLEQASWWSCRRPLRLVQPQLLLPFSRQASPQFQLSSFLPSRTANTLVLGTCCLKVWLRLSSVPKQAKTVDEKRKTFSINVLHGMGVDLCYLCCCGSPFSPQVSPTTTGLHVNYLHLAHQHECAMTELSAKQSPSILAFISLVARHMAGSHGGTLSSPLKSYHQRPKKQMLQEP